MRTSNRLQQGGIGRALLVCQRGNPMALSSMHFAFDERLLQVSENNPTMKRGETGDPVAKVQGALVDLGYKMPVTTHSGRSSPDGIFGPETEGVVRHYQRDKRLDADGIVGRHTLAALDDDMATDEANLVSSRSEERRVGKECTSRWERD